MGFSSLVFIYLIGLPSILCCFILEKTKLKCKRTLQDLVLILISLAFFAWSNITHLVVLALIIALNYAVGILSEKYGKKVLLIGIALNVCILVYFKYTVFLVNSLSVIFSSLDKITLDIIAPIGISFITFHTISYLMDIYTGKEKPCHSIKDLILYITFFPKLIQGPIVKYSDFEATVKNRVMNFDTVTKGTERFILGLIKKVLVADVLAQTVNEIFALIPTGMDAGTAWIGIICFTLQLYIDFSGYSDMAIGLAEIFGIKFKENFNFPYRSKSIAEFWQRWHISLGQWFKEYLYFPLGGSRTGNVYVNLFVVFLVTGIWHGASWMFILWGVGHGLCRMFEKYNQDKEWYKAVPSCIKWFCTMFLVNLGWIVFRVGSGADFIQYVKYMFGLSSIAKDSLTFSAVYFLETRTIFLVLLSVAVIAIVGNEKVQNKLRALNEESKIFCVVKYIVLVILAVISFAGIISGGYSPFLYFRF